MTPDNSELDFQTICEVCSNMGLSQSLALQFLTRHVDKFVYYFKMNTRGRLFAAEVYFFEKKFKLMLCSVVLWASETRTSMEITLHILDLQFRRQSDYTTCGLSQI